MQPFKPTRSGSCCCRWICCSHALHLEVQCMIAEVLAWGKPERDRTALERMAARPAAPVQFPHVPLTRCAASSCCLLLSWNGWARTMHMMCKHTFPNWGFHLWNAEKQAAKWVAFTKQGFVCHYLGQPLKELSKAWVRLCKSVLPSCIYLLAAVHCRRQSLRQR